MKILFVASECSPIVKVGGLADVVGSLPKALKKLKANVAILIPFYGVINLKKEEMKLVLGGVEIKLGNKIEKFNLWQTFLPGSKVPVFLIENKKYFSGGVYVEADASSGGSKREAEKFLFLSLAGIKIAKTLNFNIIHCQDWHTAIIPFLIKKEKIKIKTLLTIHNLQYQGIYPRQIVNSILNANFTEDVNCLREGIINADIINTVSPTYVKEIRTPQYGYGLEKFIKKRNKDVTGIINGLDIKIFNPQTDPAIVSNYSTKNLQKKEENKTYLQKKCFGAANSEIPLFGIVSRLAEQKGVDLIRKIFPVLMKENIQFILLGAGRKEYENFFREKMEEFPRKFWTKIGYDKKLAHQIYAGADIFLMPSLFEPCGLGQLIAMRYGTVPIVRATGGLKDTVLPMKYKKDSGTEIKGTGFTFKNYDAREFLKTIKETLNIYKNRKIWKQIQEDGMNKDFSWNESAKKYLKIYEKLNNKL